MQNLTSDQLAELTFDNSAVTEMNVDPASKTLTIQCDRAFLDRGDDTVEIQNVIISVTGYDDIQARIYDDESFVNVEVSDETYHLAEICEFTADGKKTMFSGFSNQEGAWSDYTIEGGVFAVAHR